MNQSWDIFCRVIDNHGDLGICWRLSADLAQRGHRVRLWVDDAAALTWMAPQGCMGVEVRTWPDDAALQRLALDRQFAVADVVIEAFGCELPLAFQALMVRDTPPLWLNLEYLSAESYVEKSHGLPSPVMHGPARGCTKWFFYPGFTAATGGLLREPSLLEARQHFQAQEWLATLHLPLRPQARRASLFCYEPAVLPSWLQQLAENDLPLDVLVAAGRPQAAVRSALQALGWSSQTMPQTPTKAWGLGTPLQRGSLALHALPYLSQIEFDHLLWSCHLNLVRGEDSLVRALWAGQPLVWHLYPQDDLAHHDKLAAFTRLTHMPDSLQQFHAAWNGVQAVAIPRLTPQLLDTWQIWADQTRQKLAAQEDLTGQLLGFVAQKS